MDWLQAILLGVVEGVTEFLPVSSTGHLTIAEQLLGLPVDDPGVTAFTAIIQVGAILAVIIYFRSDIARLIAGFVRGLGSAQARRAPAWREAWAGPLRSLWVVAVALIAWSAVMVLANVLADRTAARAPSGCGTRSWSASSNAWRWYPASRGRGPPSAPACCAVWIG